MIPTAYVWVAHTPCYERRESDEAADTPHNRMRGHRGSNPWGVERISRSVEQPDRCRRHGRMSRSGFLRVCCCRGCWFRPRPAVDRHRTRSWAGKSGSRSMHGELRWPDVHPLRAVRRARLSRTRPTIVRGLRPRACIRRWFFGMEATRSRSAPAEASASSTCATRPTTSPRCWSSRTRPKERPARRRRGAYVRPGPGCATSVRAFGSPPGPFSGGRFCAARSRVLARMAERATSA
jgi:hypothetical protein